MTKSASTTGFRRSNTSVHSPAAQALIALVLFFYSILYPPFFTTHWIPDTLRLSFEAVSVSVLLFISFLKSERNFYRDLILILLFTLVFIVFRNSEFRTYLSEANKLILGVCLISLFQRRQLSQLLFRQLFFVVLIFTSIQILFAQLMAGISPSLFVSVQKIDEFQYINYGYYYHWLLGNMMYINGVPRALGYFVEPGYAAGFLSIGLAYLFQRKEKSVRDVVAIYLLFAAGVFTGSQTFYVTIVCLLGFVYAGKFLVQIKGKKLLQLFLVIVGLLSAFVVFVGVYKIFLTTGSLTNRLVRLESAYSSFVQLKASELVFGMGAGASAAAGQSFSMGWLLLALERGLPKFILVIYILSQIIGRSRLLQITIFLFSFAFEFFWWPLFWIGLASVSDFGPETKSKMLST